MAKKTMNLKRKLWIYFGLFAIIIMAILWIMQTLFLTSFYETMKVSEMSRMGRKIIREYKEDNSNLMDIVLEAHFKYGLSVSLYNEQGMPILGADSYSMPRNSMDIFPTVREKLESSPTSWTSFIFTENNGRYQSAIFAAKLKTEAGANLYFCLSSPLSSTNATTQVLKVQLLMVTIISLIIAFILSYFIARWLSAPISKITKNASRIAPGKYDVYFSHGGYEEINQLADVLNHTAFELNKTDALRRDLMANVSHDLRTPLTIIRSYAEMIKDISGENPEKRNKHASVIIDETDRLSLLVTDILDLSKIESGVVALQQKPFDIASTISKTVNSFIVLAEKEGYIFNVSCDSALVYGDEARIQQVIYNLISNAINYTGEDKVVSVFTENKGDILRINIKDTGKGISPEEQQLVWDRYYKASQSHHRAHIGTGIGLSIVKNILTLHNAKFGIISSVGEGSTFWFELPIINNN